MEDRPSKPDAVSLEQLHASIPSLFETHYNCFLTTDENLRRRLSQSQIDLISYTILFRRDQAAKHSWGIMSLSTREDEEVIRRQQILKTAFSALPLVPADGELMAQASASSVAPFGIWALIATGVTASGEETPPLLVYPPGFSVMDTARVFLRVQEMIQNQSF